jgi:hypothetical protein
MSQFEVSKELDAVNLAENMRSYFDEIGQPYNFLYLFHAAQDMISDFKTGVAQDPYYGQ